ncbi:MAG: flagellar basal body-associated FliL family protein [Calditrichaeota bacterium]|nr:flagellar basal body-associated FliL family protein [Calditrichota bacterium]MBT7790161.1 flagellar basal body-associated FliL family protein [Calditrichota bacterium]
MVDRKKPDEEPEQLEGNEEKETKGSSIWLKWGLIIIGILIISSGAFFLVKKTFMPMYKDYVAEKQVADAEKIRNQKPEMGMVHVIKDLTVNTLGSNGRRFVIVEYVIESEDENVILELKRREPQLRDVYIKYLRRHSAEQLLDLTFQENSKSELIEITNNQLSTGKVDSLYYTKLIIQ